MFSDKMNEASVSQWIAALGNSFTNPERPADTWNRFTASEMTAFVPKSSTKPALGDVFSVCELNNEFQGGGGGGGQLLLKENSQGISQGAIRRVHLVHLTQLTKCKILLKQTNKQTQNPNFMLAYW